MTTRPRFTLKAILGCVVVLSAPLALVAAGATDAYLLELPTCGGCVGYLLDGWEGAVSGLMIGFIVSRLLVYAWWAA